MEACAAADALYASSTSGLLISDIAAKAAHPERCVGAHPYNPPHLIPLVELTSGDKTDPALLQLPDCFELEGLGHSSLPIISIAFCFPFLVIR